MEWAFSNTIGICFSHKIVPLHAAKGKVTFLPLESFCTRWNFLQHTFERNLSVPLMPLSSLAEPNKKNRRKLRRLRKPQRPKPMAMPRRSRTETARRRRRRSPRRKSQRRRKPTRRRRRRSQRRRRCQKRRRCQRWRRRRRWSPPPWWPAPPRTGPTSSSSSTAWATTLTPATWSSSWPRSTQSPAWRTRRWTWTCPTWTPPPTPLSSHTQTLASLRAYWVSWIR